MELAKEIKKLAIDKEVKIKDLADALNTSSQSLSAMMRRDNFRVSELEIMAETLGCQLEIRFVDKK